MSFPNNARSGFQSRSANQPFTGAFQLSQNIKTLDKKVNHADKRATHNAVERQRRECLNTKFQELAHALPSLQTVRRPSKSIIVQKCLDFVNNTAVKTDRYEKEIRHLRQQNEVLMAEVEKLRNHLEKSAESSPDELIMEAHTPPLEVSTSSETPSVGDFGRLSRQLSTSSFSSDSLASPVIANIGKIDESQWHVPCGSESGSSDDNSSYEDECEFGISLGNYNQYLSANFVPAMPPYFDPSLDTISFENSLKDTE
ncbi:hypothetical protein BC937DRAFT_87773 [Endogone sp. FLAS-F59071]|nr:hypothetical protein BC937DRAFT_87773 [Endogone sp. FLAS-F59071]|eukprot:RUS19255.1 hypothetical protein BC937DRAFT_87773 [Endogone sp. FLAS-F59071]